MTQKVGTYRNHDIMLTGILQFGVKFEGDDRTISADTADKIKAVIDDRLKGEAKTVKLDLPVLNGEGKKGTITGLHMGTSRVLGKGIGEVGYYARLYPDVTWVYDALREAAQLRQSLKAVESSLGPVAIKTSYGHGRCSAEDYSDKIEELRTEHAEKLASALGEEPRED